MTITSLTIATLSPFMVADAQEKVVAPEAVAAPIYNWEQQTATEGINEGEFEAGQTSLVVGIYTHRFLSRKIYSGKLLSWRLWLARINVWCRSRAHLFHR